MAPSFSPEFRLVAACAMWPPSDRRTEAIRAAAAGPLDWHRFLRVARRHQVIGLVHDGLTRARPDMPPEIAREIGAQAATLVRENLAMAREVIAAAAPVRRGRSAGPVRQGRSACRSGLW